MTLSRMNKKSHKTLLWMVAVLAIIGAGAFGVMKTSIGEGVKRESAKLFDYEYIPNQAVEIAGTEAAVAADSIYKDFRKKFRFHYQTVGMASFADSSRMILLSDIPPHFETDSIAPIFAKFTHKTELRKHPIGYDGYTTDVVILLGNATQENCDRLIHRLNRELFFSDYKPVVMTLPAEEKRRYFAKNEGNADGDVCAPSLDYQITLEEFNNWFIEEGEGFICLDNSTPQSADKQLTAPLKQGGSESVQSADKRLTAGSPPFKGESPKNKQLTAGSPPSKGESPKNKQLTAGSPPSKGESPKNKQLTAGSPPSKGESPKGEGVKQESSQKVLTVSDIFAQKARGVFFSQEPGFVAWALPKNADLADTLTQPHDNAITQSVQDIRQFTLDADLILGALADSSTLVIIGRERQSPLYELPPLQVESILLLASTTEKELSQSLDINDLMAGKMVNGRDWCPTYLSRELENTEFGDLMTLTDVLLKDWSERGTIQEGYYRYPEPGYYPFDRPLFRKLGLSELVYNWNTAGAMYAIDCDGYTIYTLGRTGSLPVSYFNSQERSQSIGYRYEAQAYHYFATLGCTDLARVVQYTALYQLFIDNNISYSGNTYPSSNKKAFLLYKPTTELLDKLRGLSGEEIALLADSLAGRSFRSYQKEHVDKQLRDNEQQHNFSYSDENRDRIYQDVHRNTQAGVSRSIHEVKGMLNGLSEEQMKQLARYLSYPRGVKVGDRESYNTYLRARRVNQLMREVGKNNLDLIGMDLGKVKNWYAGCLTNYSGRYMKTPTLIVTFNDLLTTGGHNLSSRISRVNRMTNYKRSRNYTPTDYERPAEPDVHTPSPEKGNQDTPSPLRGTPPNVGGERDGKQGTPPNVGGERDGKQGAPTNIGGEPRGKSSGKNPSPSTAPAKKKPSSSSNQTVKPSSSNNVRPRSSVISTAPRTRRGL